MLQNWEKNSSTTKYIHLPNQQMLGFIQRQTLSPAEDSWQSIFMAVAPTEAWEAARDFWVGGWDLLCWPNGGCGSHFQGYLSKNWTLLFLIKTFLQFLLPPAISCVRSPKVGLPWVLSKSQILESEVEP